MPRCASSAAAADGFACARLSVPHRSQRRACRRRVSLLVKRVRARRRGGPRGRRCSSSPAAPASRRPTSFGGDALGVLYPAYRSRDLIVFDQRGTGRSGLWRCRSAGGSRTCSGGSPRRRPAPSRSARGAPFYTSRDSADDIEAVRTQIGAERIALFGTVRHQGRARLRAALPGPRSTGSSLDSVVEIDGRTRQPGLARREPRALRSLCGRRCTWTRDPVADLAGLVDSLRARGPLRGRVVTRAEAAAGPALARRPVHDPDRGRLRSGAARRRSRVPCARRSAATPTPLLRLRRRAFAVDAASRRRRVSSARRCTPRRAARRRLCRGRGPRRPIAAERPARPPRIAASIPDSAFEPFDRATALAQRHARPSPSSLAAMPAAPVFGSARCPTPALPLEGEDDLRTPVENARRNRRAVPALAARRRARHGPLDHRFPT